MIKFFRKIHHSIFLLTCLFFVLGCANYKSSLPDPLQAGWKSQSICEVIQDNDQLRVLKCTFKPGEGHEKHYHKPHFGYTISGSKMRITDAKGMREVNVATGSNFFSKGVVWHEVLNIGDSTAVFLIIEPK